MPHLQHLLGSLLDDAGDGMPVRRPEGERLQDEQIERSLQEFELAVRLALVPVECQGEF
jgi:hypothetical protein